MTPSAATPASHRQSGRRYPPPIAIVSNVVSGGAVSVAAALAAEGIAEPRPVAATTRPAWQSANASRPGSATNSNGVMSADGQRRSDTS
jgi:hypothetical protein